MKRSDLLMILAATALLKPCFFKNKVKTAFASSLSAAKRVGDTTFELNDPFVPESAVNISRTRWLMFPAEIAESTSELDFI